MTTATPAPTRLRCAARTTARSWAACRSAPRPTSTGRSPPPGAPSTPTRSRRGSAAEILDAAARALKERNEDFARIIAGEAAKPLKTARVEAARAVSTFTFAAVEARKLAGEMIPIEAAGVGEGKLGFTLRLPIGVVGAISPFNFPLNLVAHKVAPAIAAGCPVVLKPASADAAVGHRARRPAARRVRAAGRASSTS